MEKIRPQVNYKKGTFVFVVVFLVEGTNERQQMFSELCLCLTV